MILHLFHDDKVCNQTVANFEQVFPGNNIYICICDVDNLRYVRKDDKIIFLNKKNYTLDSSILNRVEKIIIHYLDIDKISFIERFYPHNTKAQIYWCLWGGDMYNQVLYFMGYDIYDDKSYVHTVKSKLLYYYNRCLNLLCINRDNKIVSFIQNRINYVLTFQEEYNLICQKWLSTPFKPKCIPNLPIYYAIEDILGPLFDKKVNGNNIIIGNSASFTNNHTYAYRHLAKIDTKGYKKISPLSYGGSFSYREHVKDVGYKYWGKDYYPLEKFLPLSEYNELMLSSSIYIYGNWRQEAVGNIVMALYLGAKVYVSERSPLLSIFADYGIKLYKTEQISSLDFFESEDERTLCHNRQKILSLYSKSAILDNIKRIFG